MAFTGLFSSLFAGVQRFPHRDDGENNRRGNICKGKTRSDEADSYREKQYYGTRQTRTHHVPASFNDDDSEAINSRLHRTSKEHATVGFSRELGQSHSKKADHNNFYRKVQNPKNKCDMNRQKRQNREDAGQHGQRDQRWTPSRGRGCQSRPAPRRDRPVTKNNEKERKTFTSAGNVPVQRERFMTQEFKDQNGMCVDGQLLCRHFLRGKCIKGDDCQLLHVEGVNDMIKEVCKFYIQGFCMKGESCPYMHKSFPCKFFHRLGRCSQGADCRFSHEPLTDVTNQLLEEAIKRDSGLMELAKKAEKFPSEQPAKTDQSPAVDESVVPDVDVLTQPIRPNFYNSTDPLAEKDTVCRMEDLADEVQPQSPKAANAKEEAPVCYSVEAVLGPQLSKPFPSFFGTTGGKVSAPPSVPPASFDYAVPSAKPSSALTVEDPTFGPSPTPLVAQAVSATPKAVLEELAVPQQNRIVVDSSQEEPFKRLPFFQARTRPVPTFDRSTKTRPDLSLNSEDTAEAQKPGQRTSEVKLGSLHSAVAVLGESASPRTKGGTKMGSACHKSFTPRSAEENQQRDLKYSTDCKSKSDPSFGPAKPTGKVLFGLFSRSLNDASRAPPRSFNASNELKGRGSTPASSVRTTAGHRVAVGQSADGHQDSTAADTGVRPETQQQDSHEGTTEGGRQTANCADLSAARRETQSKRFQSLFESPVVDGLQQGSVTSPSSAKGQRPSPRPADVPGPAVNEAARPLLGISASPVSEAAAPHSRMQSRVAGGSSCPREPDQPASGSSQRAAGLERPFPGLFSGLLSNDAKKTSDNHTASRTSQTENPVCSFVSDSPGEMSKNPLPNSNTLDPSAIQTRQQLSEIPSPKGTSATSVLKTLFVSLGPYQQDAPGPSQQDAPGPSQQDAPRPSQQDAQQQARDHIKSPPEIEDFMPCEVQHEAKRRKKDDGQHLKNSACYKSTFKKVDPAQHQSLDFPGGLALHSPALSDAQVRTSGTQSDRTVNPAVPRAQRHSRSTLKEPTDEGNEGVGGKVGFTPLKDLFKAFGPTAFNFGH